MNIIELDKLRKSLPKRWMATLSERTGKSKVYVWQVLNGKERNNNAIIDAAIILAKETKAREENRKLAITNL